MEINELADQFEKENASLIVANKNEITSTVDKSAYDNISNGVKAKINDPKNIENHTKKLTSVGNKIIRANIEEQDVKAERKQAENKVEKQKITNDLYVLKQEHKRLVKEQRHLNKQQREMHKSDINKARWEKYGAKLTKMGYCHCPNMFALSILMGIHDISEFFDGLSTLGDKFMKAMKYVILIAFITIVMMIIPVTREWLLNILGFINI